MTKLAKCDKTGNNTIKPFGEQYKKVPSRTQSQSRQIRNRSYVHKYELFRMRKCDTDLEFCILPSFFMSPNGMVLYVRSFPDRTAPVHRCFFIFSGKYQLYTLYLCTDVSFSQANFNFTQCIMCYFFV